MRYAYSVTIARDEDGFTVTCADVPELVTCGDTYAEAVERAQDALVSALSFYVDEGQALPPTHGSGDVEVSVPALEATKLALHDAMLSSRVSNIELGRRLGLDEKAVRRLRDPLHRSHVGHVEAALRALGRRVVLDIEETPEFGEPGGSDRRRAA